MEPKKDLDFSLVKIEGERILLNPISSSFSEDIFGEFTSEITRYMFPASPTELSQVISFIELSREDMKNRSDLVLVISDISTGEFLGVCSLHGKNNPKEPEIGVWLKKNSHFKHYGREAIYYLVKWLKKISYLII